MEKLGVVIDDEKTKTASTDKVCPSCGTKLPGNQQTGSPDANGEVFPPWYCPRCGTKPFEKRP